MYLTYILTYSVLKNVLTYILMYLVHKYNFQKVLLMQVLKYILLMYLILKYLMPIPGYKNSGNTSFGSNDEKYKLSTVVMMWSHLALAFS